MTSIPLLDAMLGIITAAIYAIIFAGAFIFGFLETAVPPQLIPF